MTGGFRRGAILALILAFLIIPGWSEQEASSDAKTFEGAVAFSQSLSGWALLIAGGSIIILVGTSYYRPKQRRARLMYLWFLPGWYYLARCMYSGVNVQRAYLGYLFSKPAGDKLTSFRSAVNDDAFLQIVAMERAMFCFGFWLLLYLVWWLFNRDVQTTTGGNP
jgi:hypothetical protein